MASKRKAASKSKPKAQPRPKKAKRMFGKKDKSADKSPFKDYPHEHVPPLDAGNSSHSWTIDPEKPKPLSHDELVAIVCNLVKHLQDVGQGDSVIVQDVLPQLAREPVEPQG